MGWDLGIFAVSVGTWSVRLWAAFIKVRTGLESFFVTQASRACRVCNHAKRMLTTESLLPLRTPGLGETPKSRHRHRQRGGRALYRGEWRCAENTVAKGRCEISAFNYGEELTSPATSPSRTSTSRRPSQFWPWPSGPAPARLRATALDQLHLVAWPRRK